MDIFIEHTAIIIYITVITLKVITSIVAEKKLKKVYENIARSWEIIKDKNERNILIQHSERGRVLTIGYLGIVYMMSALVVFTLFPLTPVILNVIKPLNGSRPLIFILGGDFFVDRDTHYGKIFLFDALCCIPTVIIISAVDSMYATCIEHCLGLFAIIKFRLQLSTKSAGNEYSISKMERRDVSYDFIVETIQLHKKVIIFTETLESSYSSSFLILMGLNTLILSFESVLILIKLDKIMEFIRFSCVLFGTIVHLFYISWPGQKLIDSSLGLFRDAYVNEWYESSIKAKKLLGFITLRCSRPCQLTAGGIYVMNFNNFASLVKTSMSYMTLFASLR